MGSTKEEETTAPVVDTPTSDAAKDAMKKAQDLVSGAALSQFSQQLSEQFKKFEPAVQFASKTLDQAYPYLERAWKVSQDVWEKLQPYHPDEFLPALFGLFLCFFGGMYFTTFAAIEAYKVCGFDKTRKQLKVLYEDYLIVRDESKKDDEIDADGDGVADVKQITRQELFSRKLRLILKASNPDKVQVALTGLYTGFMGVVATLRFQFARTVTLGVVIGDVIHNAVGNYVQPALVAACPQEYAKWIPVGVSYACRIFGMSIAWFVQRVISAYYSAIRGAQIFASGVMLYTGRNGYTLPFDEKSPVFTGVVTVTAILGCYWQLSSGFTLGFPLNLIFFPFTCIEYFLMWMVGVEA